MNSPNPPPLWLAANRRPARVAALFSPLFFACGGLFTLWRSPITAEIAWGLLTAAIVATGVTFRLWQPPLIRYDQAHLVLRFPGVKALHVPLAAIESFFIGAAKYQRPGSPPREAVAVVVRLAEAALEWKQCDVPAEYTQWSDGYVVLQLNRWYVAAKKSSVLRGSLK